MQNPNLKSLTPLKQNPNLPAPLFNVHLNFRKEKEKFSYNLLREKEKETEKFIDKFLSISQIDSLTSLNKYEKEIVKTYIKYGGKLKESEITILGIILLSLIINIYFYPQMPEKIASHWNAQGQVDGYMSKFWGLFLMPFILVGLALLFFVIPRIDPLKANIEKFRKYYDGFIILFFVFMLSIHFQVILWNIGIKISPNVILPIGLGLLFFYVGILCENAKRNWFIGIRTPWTLSNDVVWDKTHKIGGKLFKIARVVALFGIFFQKYTLFFILVLVILIAAYTIIYSYIEYQKEMK